MLQKNVFLSGHGRDVFYQLTKSQTLSHTTPIDRSKSRVARPFVGFLGKTLVLETRRLLQLEMSATSGMPRTPALRNT